MPLADSPWQPELTWSHPGLTDTVMTVAAPFFKYLRLLYVPPTPSHLPPLHSHTHHTPHHTHILTQCMCSWCLICPSSRFCLDWTTCTFSIWVSHTTAHSPHTSTSHPSTTPTLWHSVCAHGVWFAPPQDCVLIKPPVRFPFRCHTTVHPPPHTHFFLPPPHCHPHHTPHPKPQP